MRKEENHSKNKYIVKNHDVKTRIKTEARTAAFHTVTAMKKVVASMFCNHNQCRQFATAVKQRCEAEHNKTFTVVNRDHMLTTSE